MSTRTTGGAVAWAVGSLIGVVLVFLAESAGVMVAAYLLAEFTRLGVPALGYGESMVVAATLNIVGAIMAPKRSGQ